jgi:hypothetical protein
MRELKLAMKNLEGEGIANFHFALTKAFELHSMVRNACVNPETKFI